jgi:D-alanyl-lipoteichoic acid acyltransferase DltB (MBOAT superfamily)
MIFNSLTFLLFLLIVVPLYWLLPKVGRLWLIFISSLVFYGFWRLEFILIMMITPLLDYFMAHAIVRSNSQRQKKQLLVISIILNLALLVYFKYLMFFSESVNSLSTLIGLDFHIPKLNIILPIGISFYTFHTMSFIIDTYRGFVKPPSSFITYGCYVFFFPQLVAGPILRVGEVVEQLEQKHVFKAEHILYGLKRILFGLLLKVGLADNIGTLVDDGFSQSVATLSAIDVWTLAFMFGFQIYFDFSAYSSIAIGAARLLGIQFPENFNFPYMAASPKAFWKRWHISLSSWIRDYLYLPLAGQKVVDRYNAKSEGGLPTFKETEKISKTIIPLFLTWGIMGLWHGANWTFVFWGVYHAIIVLIHRIISPYTRNLPTLLLNIGGWGITLLFAMLSWIPFRAENMAVVVAMFKKLVYPASYTFLGMRENIYLIAGVLMLCIILAYLFERYIWNYIQKNFYLKVSFETIAYTFALIVVIIFLRPVSQFIYFQF